MKQISSTFTVNTVEDGDTIQTVSVYKISNDLPTTPSGDAQVPSGWSATPPRIYGWEFSDVNAYSGYRQGKGQNINNNFVVERVTFTAVSGTPVVVRIVASSEATHDFVYVGALDEAQTSRPSTKPEGRYVSGNRTTLDVSTAINSSGTHFLDIVYTKDSSLHNYSDCGFYKVISGADNIVYSNPRTVWISTAKFINGSLSGSWSTPVPYIENKKSVIVPEDGVTYEVRTDVENIKIPSNVASVSQTITAKFYKKKGEESPVLQGAYIEFYLKSGSSFLCFASSLGSSMITETLQNIASGLEAVAIFVFSEQYEGAAPNSQSYLAKKEIPVIKNGDRGKTGRAYYYAGTFVGDSTSHVVNDAQAPFFDYTTSGQKRYYVYAPDANPSGGTITEQAMGTPNPNNNSNWKNMTSDFEYLITKAVFGEFAHFGSAIINGDWLISQHGTINGVASQSYQDFDPTHPMDNNTTNFIPNYAVDLLSGRTYQSNGIFKGSIGTPYTIINSSNYSSYMTKIGNFYSLNFGSTAFNVQIDYWPEDTTGQSYDIRLPNPSTATDLVGAEIRIFNTNQRSQSLKVYMNTRKSGDTSMNNRLETIPIMGEYVFKLVDLSARLGQSETIENSTVYSSNYYWIVMQRNTLSYYCSGI